ncbi:hypothetical protein US8_02044 [Bacillus altitudinis]|nr:hypothetical protein US8_02044 [Bacillus altitudinis]
MYDFDQIVVPIGHVIHVIHLFFFYRKGKEAGERRRSDGI